MLTHQELKQGSQTEREALAVEWGTEQFHLYIYGKSVEIITDHKPLEGLFNNPRSKLNARIERWSIRMQGRYEYISTWEESRYAVEPIPPNPKDSRSTDAEQYVNFIENYAIPKALSTEEVRKATLEDDMLQ